MADRDVSRERADRPLPPAVRRGPARPLVLIGFGFVLFCILVVVVLNIDSGYEQRQRGTPEDEIIELIAPRAMSRDELESRSADGSQRNAPRDLQPQLSKGGTIEIADPQTQQLAQRYRFESLDPNPEGAAPGWLRMIQPRMEIFLDDGNVVTLSGDTALAYRPHRLIESGTMSGNVVLRLYEGENGREIDLTRDEPSWTVTTDKASLDNFLGEIRCEGDVLIESARMTLPGRDLRVLVDDQSNRIELTIYQPEYIRLVPETSRRRNVQATDRTARTYVVASSERPQVRTASLGRANAEDDLDVSTIGRFDVSPEEERPGQFYLLTLRENVVIKQNDPASRRTAKGDLLEIVFSTRTTGLDSALAAMPTMSRPLADSRYGSSRVHGPLPMHHALAMHALTAVDGRALEDEQLLGPDVTLIRCRGPLTIVPLADSSRHLASPRDARLELTGSPVHLTDAANQSEAFGRMLSYHAGEELVELSGSNEFPLRVASPEMEAGGERFFLSQATNQGGFDGGGWMTHRGDERPVVETDELEARPRTELHITWQRGMDLQFGEATAGERSDRLRSAIFTGDVKVATDEFNMGAEEMTVGFTDEADPSAGLDAGSLDFIHARGMVRVVGVGKHHAIRCDDLHLDLTRASNGNTIPNRMIALGGVEAIDDDQVIWSDSLHVSFREGEEGETQVEELIAETDVQVLLADGTRAFADRLVGDGVSERVELTGEDVAVISDKMMMDRGKQLVLDRGSGTATSPGPGSLRIFDQPVLGEDRSRIDRPAINEDERTIELRTNWTESMVFDSSVNDGAGSVDFRGEVDVLSHPTPLERNTMTGNALTIEFQRSERESHDDQPREAASGVEEQRAGRDVRRFIARGDAKIESQTFTTPEHDDEPAIFYIAGDYVEYDTITSEARVAGKGEMLIHDITPDDKAVSSTAPFGHKGSTMMRWTRELRMTRAVDDVFTIVTRGEVELRHRDLDGTISTMTSERLETTVRRPDDDEPRTTASGGLDMGGSAELQRVRGSGGVVIRTDRRTVDCDHFDYDVASGIARISADPGRVVSIQTAGSPNVVTAAEAIWNMERDSIHIIRAAGASGE